MPNSEPLRVVQLSDFHIKSQPSRLWGVDVDESLEKVLACVKARDPQPDLLLVTGDLVGDDPSAYQRVSRILSVLQIPAYCLPGNHDFPRTMSQVLQHGLVRWERYIKVGAWQFILLDSSFPETPDGHLAYTELAFLDTVLALEPAAHSVVCLHHNPVPSHTPWLDTMTVHNGDALFAILSRHPQVRAVVWGHLHGEFSDMWRGVHLLAAPATSVQFKPRTPEPQADTLLPGYRWLELEPDGTLRTGVERIA